MSLILIVDDEHTCREWAARTVREAGHEPLVVGDGAGALLLLKSRQPDLVLLDINMPGLDGVGFLLTARAGMRANVPVIVITGGATADVRAVLGRLNVQAVLTKAQLTSEALLAEVERALASRRTDAA